MNRADGIARLCSETFDVLVIGGGATGLGAAVDAAARGYRTALIEAGDFATATSSRSTKLVHGGVRYLRAGHLGLVRESLRERDLLFANAPHLVHELHFVVPAYGWAPLATYAAGLKAYDALAGRTAFARSRIVRSRETLRMLPALRERGLRGAVVYADGQFDDARLAVTLARTAVDRGAALANYVRAMGFVYRDGRVAGVDAVDQETGAGFAIAARAVINATGIFVDEVRALDAPASHPLLAFSRGSHIVVDADALGGGECALLVPRTDDGRVLFATPWHGRVLIGTTDVAAPEPQPNPVPPPEEIAYLLETVNRYLVRPLASRNVLSAFAGLRPLPAGAGKRTADLARRHVIDVGASGLITITGGKWTTYRAMGERAVTIAAERAGLRAVRSPTANMRLHGADGNARDDTLGVYGSDAKAIVALGDADPALRRLLHARLPYTAAQVMYAARAEMARSVDDVLARRTRAAVLDAAAAREAAPLVAELLARELGRDAAWQRREAERFRAPAAAAREAAGTRLAGAEREPPARPT